LIICYSIQQNHFESAEALGQHATFEGFHSVRLAHDFVSFPFLFPIRRFSFCFVEFVVSNPVCLPLDLELQSLCGQEQVHIGSDRFTPFAFFSWDGGWMEQWISAPLTRTESSTQQLKSDLHPVVQALI
jgi:hypothetical protein